MDFYWFLIIMAMAYLPKWISNNCFKCHLNQLLNIKTSPFIVNGPKNYLIKKSSLDLSAIHNGFLPRPVHVLPVSGLRYLGGTLATDFEPDFIIPARLENKSSEVNPYSSINAKTFSMPMRFSCSLTS